MSPYRLSVCGRCMQCIRLQASKALGVLHCGMSFRLQGRFLQETFLGLPSGFYWRQSTNRAANKTSAIKRALGSLMIILFTLWT
jgi:hypothetical protein